MTRRPGMPGISYGTTIIGIFLVIVVVSTVSAVPDTAAPIVPGTIEPAITIVPVSYQYELKHDGGTPTTLRGLHPNGYVVFFPLDNEIVVRGVRMYSSRREPLDYNLTVEIWDKNTDLMYHYEVPYERSPFMIFKDNSSLTLTVDRAAWVDVKIPDTVINDDFYLVVFTGPYEKNYEGVHGTFVGYEVDRNPDVITSFMTQTGHDKLDKSGPWGSNQYHWLIRALYSPYPLPPEPQVTMTLPYPYYRKETVLPEQAMDESRAAIPPTTDADSNVAMMFLIAGLVLIIKRR